MTMTSPTRQYVPPSTNPLKAVLCGQVWGTDCRHPVSSPMFVHGMHWESTIGRYCPPAVLAILARHSDSAVRWEVALHPNCPLGALRLLTADRAMQVAQAAGLHPTMVGGLGFGTPYKWGAFNATH